MTSPKAAAKKSPGLVADAADALTERALEHLPAWLAGMTPGNAERWPDLWKDASEALSKYVEDCKRLEAESSDKAWTSELKQLRTAAQRFLAAPAPELLKENDQLRLHNWRLGEVLQRSSKETLQADLTLELEWDVAHSISVNTSVFDLGAGFDESERSASTKENWSVSTVSAPKPYFSTERQVWRLLVAPPDAGMLKVFTRLRQWMAAAETGLTHKFGVITQSPALAKAAQDQGFRAMLVPGSEN